MSDEENEAPEFTPNVSQVQSGTLPNEFEAWKTMMESMITFIASSTRLLNTINSRAKRAGGDIVDEAEARDADATSATASSAKCSAPCSVVGSSEAVPVEAAGKCEEECIVCKNKTGNECRVCGAPKEGDGEDAEGAAGKSSSAGLCVCSQVRKIKEEARKVGVKVDGKKPTQAGEGEEATQAGEGEGKKCEETGSELKSNCAYVDNKTEVTDGACRCSPRTHRGADPFSQLCSCEMGPKEESSMREGIMERLNTLRDEINQMHKEMSVLQEKEYIRQSRTAALYREIMKDGPLDTSASKRGPSGTRGGPNASFGGNLRQGYGTMGPPACCSTMTNSNNPGGSTYMGQPMAVGNPSTQVYGSLNPTGWPDVSTIPLQGLPSHLTSANSSGITGGPGTASMNPTVQMISGSPPLSPPRANMDFNKSGPSYPNQPGKFDIMQTSTPRGSAIEHVCAARATQTAAQGQAAQGCNDYTCDDQCVVTTEKRTTRTAQGLTTTTTTTTSGNPSLFADQ